MSFSPSAKIWENILTAFHRTRTDVEVVKEETNRIPLEKETIKAFNRLLEGLRNTRSGVGLAK